MARAACEKDGSNGASLYARINDTESARRFTFRLYPLGEDAVPDSGIILRFL
jgi:hypothetical protein